MVRTARHLGHSLIGALHLQAVAMRLLLACQGSDCIEIEDVGPEVGMLGIDALVQRICGSHPVAELLDCGFLRKEGLLVPRLLLLEVAVD